MVKEHLDGVDMSGLHHGCRLENLEQRRRPEWAKDVNIGSLLEKELHDVTLGGTCRLIERCDAVTRWIWPVSIKLCTMGDEELHEL